MVEDNLKYFNAEHWKSLLANPANCQYIKNLEKPKTIDWSRLPTIDAECAAHMSTDVFKAMLANKAAAKKFDEHILSFAYKGILPVESLEAVAKNRIELLKHLGKSIPVGEDHPCNHFSLDDYKDKGKKNVRLILDNSNSGCIRSISGLDTLEDEDASEDLFKGLPHTIFAALDVENLKAHKHLPKNFWSEMKPLVFEILATPANCAELDTTLLAQINPEARVCLSS